MLTLKMQPLEVEIFWACSNLHISAASQKNSLRHHIVQGKMSHKKFATHKMHK